MRVRFTPLAESDVELAMAYYEGIDPELADDFVGQMDVVVQRLEMFPNGAPPVDGFPGVRRSRMRRFPFGVFHRVDEAGVIVLRVLHTRRDPGVGLTTGG